MRLIRLASMDRMVGLRNISEAHRSLNVISTPDGGVILTFAPIDDPPISEQNFDAPSAGATVYSEDDVRSLVAQFTEMQQALVRQSQQLLDAKIPKLPPMVPVVDECPAGGLVAPEANDKTELPGWLTHRISELDRRNSVWNRIWGKVLGNR
jgi:hypothetical protein